MDEALIQQAIEKGVTSFQLQVYELCSKVPAGRVTTYGEIAKAMNKGGFGARAVGMALNKNPFAPQVPCHRVVAYDGHIGGFAHGPIAKIKILTDEGVTIKDNYVEDFDSVVFRF